MTLLSSQIEMMKATAQSTFTDTCSIHTSTAGTPNSLGEVTETFSTVNNVACGFNETNTFKNWRGETVTYDADAILRLPLTTSVNSKTEFTVRGKRYKTDGITIGKLTNIIKLKRVNTND